MVALQIRGVPESIRDDLSRAARQRGLSLQAYLLELVEGEARRARRASWLDEARSRSVIDSPPGAPSMADLIRRDRDRDAGHA
ncbi:MAG: hypothetical protein QM611_04880 [Microbacterium sp.]|uniref:hypothetical protein n=1 Tax=Microbacterium sp. TaxID=51671 RepID=UPI0039E4F422